MPLPLPNLDDRRWADLVEEGVALVPRYAPAWTDHNVHDPGITLIELFAWLTEQSIYRANRVTDRHRRKFLALVGHSPWPPRPARAVVGVTLAGGAGPLDLPAGCVFLATPPGQATVPFTLASPATLIEGSLAALQVHDGVRFTDRSPALRDHAPILAFGPAPRPADGGDGPGLYLGFDHPWPPGRDVTLHFNLHGTDAGERERLLAEAAARALACAPPSPCAPDESTPAEPPPPPPLPPHHSVRLSWDYLAADGWRELDLGSAEVVDDTRSLTLDGTVRFHLPAPMAAGVVGAVDTTYHWIRCRIARGAYDAAPRIVTVLLNPLQLEQSLPVLETFTILPGVVPSGAITAGARVALDLDFDAHGAVTGLGPAVAGSAAPVLPVVDHRPATAEAAGVIVLAVRRLLVGSGLPEQHAELEDAPVADGRIEVRTREAGEWRRWGVRADLDASGPRDHDVALEPTGAELCFGDGERGRVPPAGAAMLASWSSTLAAAGNVRAGTGWALASEPASPLEAAGAALNRALLGSDPAALAVSFAALVNPDAAAGGADEETIGQAAARAAELLWAHERLIELCPSDGCETLDQLDPAEVRARAEPHRAVTALDFERIALEVPGTRVRRARAWPGVDARYPCLAAPGTVTLVIVPALPVGRPAPTPGLLRAVRGYLERRRTLCTRLVIVGPSYRVVRVHARVRAHPGADPTRVGEDIALALRTFLDPLEGGSAGRGWPFGRDVYRSEVLHVIDGVAGVDHVLSCELSTEGCEPTCGNICMPATALAASGDHRVEVVQP